MERNSVRSRGRVPLKTRAMQELIHPHSGWSKSYVRMIPSEYSSGGRQRLGGLSKQGHPLLRFLWCEAAMHAVRRDPELQRFYRRKLIQKGLGKARVAVARKLGIRLWIMLRDQIDYNEFCRRGQMRQKNGSACAGMPDTAHGAKQSPTE